MQHYAIDFYGRDIYGGYNNQASYMLSSFLASHDVTRISFLVLLVGFSIGVIGEKYVLS